MIRRNDLKDILYKASLDASKPEADEVWGDVLASLDEQLPVKKKKRRFLFIFLLLGGITLFSGVWMMSTKKSSLAENRSGGETVNGPSHSGVTGKRTDDGKEFTNKTVGN